MVNWTLIKAKLKKLVRWILKRYRKELDSYVNEWVDQKLLEVNRVISVEVRKRIKSEIVAQAIEDGLDIYTSSGAETVKTLIAEQLDKIEH